MNDPCNFPALLKALNGAGVRYVVIGGVASIAHGMARSTVDLDICYARDDENLKRLAQLLTQMHAYPRGAPKGLPFKLDVRTLKSGLNFTFDTDFGQFDALGEMEGVGGYDDVIGDSLQKSFMGVPLKILALPKLIKAKEIAGRSKDLLVLDELRALLRIQNETPGDQ